MEIDSEALTPSYFFVGGVWWFSCIDVVRTRCAGARAHQLLFVALGIGIGIRDDYDGDGNDKDSDGDGGDDE